MGLDKLPAINPRDQVLYTTAEAIKQLRINERTFRKIKARLGIEPLKKPRDKHKYYTYDMLMRFVRDYYKPESIFKAMKARHIDKLVGG